MGRRETPRRLNKRAKPLVLDQRLKMEEASANDGAPEREASANDGAPERAPVFNTVIFY